MPAPQMLQIGKQLETLDEPGLRRRGRHLEHQVRHEFEPLAVHKIWAPSAIILYDNETRDVRGAAEQLQGDTADDFMGRILVSTWGSPSHNYSDNG